MHGQDALSNYERLVVDAGEIGTQTLQWSVSAELRPGAEGTAQLWLQLQADTRVPMVCQRCLQNVEWPVQLQRWFRFVATEQQAEQEDDDADEDLLVYARPFDLRALLEDELILALPLVPKHRRCPKSLPTQVQDPEFDAAVQPPKPFAVLEKLRSKL